MDAAVLPNLRRQYRPPPDPCSRLLPGQFHADVGDAQDRETVVADQPAREADQIGAKVVSHGRYVTFQMAEVAVSRHMFLPGIGQLTVLKVAPSDAQVIYAGNGTKLYQTSNGGGAWTDITPGLPVATNFLTDVAISDTDPNIAYATFSGYVTAEKVYHTLNGGGTWTNNSGTLPNMPVDTIVYQKGAHNAVYIGTDAGVYYRNDTLPNWVPYKLGLPNVIVDDLQIDYRTKTIRAGTYGRGIWQAPLL
jgi:hypothetical protein